MTISQATPSSVSRGTAPSDNRVTSFRDLIHDQDEEEEEEEGQREVFIEEYYKEGSKTSKNEKVTKLPIIPQHRNSQVSSCGFMLGAQREVDSRLLVLPGRKVPTSWWMICLRVPKSMGL